MMFGPLTASILFTIPHWWRSEGTWFRRIITLPLLLGLCWPQYWAVRILVLGLCMKVSSWRKEKETVDKDVSSIGKTFGMCLFKELINNFTYFVEPFVEAVPQVLLLISFWSLNESVLGVYNPLFWVTFVTSILSAGFGLTKFLKLGPCRLLGGYGKISFLLVMLNMIGVLVIKGFSLALVRSVYWRYNQSLAAVIIWISSCLIPGFIYVRAIIARYLKSKSLLDSNQCSYLTSG